MGASFLHGVEVIETVTGPAPITVLKSSVIGLVGTAPSWLVGGTNVAPSVSTPTLVSSYVDAANFGPMTQGYTIPYALNAILSQGAGQVVTVNVFNPAVHFSDMVEQLTFSAGGAVNLGRMGISNLTVQPTTTAVVSNEAHTFGASGTVQLAHGVVQGASLVVTSSPAGTTYKQGTDYTVDARIGVVTRLTNGSIPALGAVLVSYGYYSGTAYSNKTDYSVDLVNGVVTALSGGTIPANGSVIASFSYADPTKVQDSDIIGAISGSTYTGLQALLTTYGTMGFFPKVLIAPGYAQNADIASALTTMAGTLRGIALVDSPPGTSVATAIANRGVAGNAFDTSSTRVMLCYPQQQFFDTGIVTTGVTLNGTLPVQNRANASGVQPYSQWVAGGDCGARFGAGLLVVAVEHAGQRDSGAGRVDLRIYPGCGVGRE